MSKVFVFTAFGGPEHQQLTERAAPVPGPGEIAIAVRAAGVNPADWKRRRGAFGTDGALPVAMGLEAAGVVTAVGEGVEGFAVGDEVLGTPARGLGAFAEHTVLDAAASVAKPADVPFTDAATIPVAATTAYDLTHQVEIEPGQTLLVLGAGGGVGLMALQIAKVHRFQAVGVASDAKRELVESTGATFVASGPGAADRVRAVAPDGIDLLADLVGGDALRALAPLLKDPSHLVSAADPATARELGGSGRVRTEGVLEKITGVVGYGLVSPNVVATYPLDRAAEALALVESGHSAGKVVIVP
ncbi:NADP-dependent oxidoreductase [Actinotalea fermentans]|uniref:NADPH:quinone reductase n=1 Tax=Actinotalea fermentans TaxID=43671 RepID=A0A511YWB2_9CELL|nr:NADP-dependent oxidoreductase [Actinotalea fermentans]KGM17542.1 NADPH:quinone reductase [Actinotalea fermentans ATCC 43279 = JCM 9966 = DSM 3133]GEN79497.1 NADPH:quinone reductase [Actinotalea fermentans]